MWIFTKYGFFSVVCASKAPSDLRGKVLDKNVVMVRARARSHLLRLQKAYALMPFKIHTDTGTDYAFRMILPKKLWVEVAAELCRDIEYGNFKDACHKATDDHTYHDALYKVWATMQGLQPGFDPVPPPAPRRVVKSRKVKK